MLHSETPALPLAIQLQDGTKIINPGLTTREYFAAMAMQGLCSDSQMLKAAMQIEGKNTDKQIAKMSVEMADALIAELDKPTPAQIAEEITKKF